MTVPSRETAFPAVQEHDCVDFDPNWRESTQWDSGKCPAGAHACLLFGQMKNVGKTTQSQVLDCGPAAVSATWVGCRAGSGSTVQKPTQINSLAYAIATKTQVAMQPGSTRGACYAFAQRLEVGKPGIAVRQSNTMKETE
jgi:hypothetical protein